MLNEAIKTREKIVTGEDNIVIVKFLAGIPGGRTLDVSGWNETTIPAGLVIIRTSDGIYKPLAVTPASTGEDGTQTPAAYAAKGSTDTYAGILMDTISKNNPEAPIMIEGVVNEEVLPYPLPSDFNLPIIKTKDEIA